MDPCMYCFFRLMFVTEHLLDRLLAADADHESWPSSLMDAQFGHIGSRGWGWWCCSQPSITLLQICNVLHTSTSLVVLLLNLLSMMWLNWFELSSCCLVEPSWATYYVCCWFVDGSANMQAWLWLKPVISWSHSNTNPHWPTKYTLTHMVGMGLCIMGVGVGITTDTLGYTHTDLYLCNHLLVTPVGLANGGVLVTHVGSANIATSSPYTLILRFSTALLLLHWPTHVCIYIILV